MILALVYIIAVSMMVVALADWATNSINNTTVFSSASQLHYAASSVTDLAIQSIRTAPIPSSTPTQGVATPLSNCWAPGPISDKSIDTKDVASWCSTVEYLSQGAASQGAATRVVTVYTCLLSAEPTGAACQANPLLTAVVGFDDYPSNGAPQLLTQCNQAGLVCGEGITLDTWVWGAAISTTQATIPQTVAFYDSSYSSPIATDAVVFGSGTYRVYAEGSGFGAITFASTTPSLCTVSASGAVTLLGVGACDLTATAAANTEYAASSAATFTLTIAQAATTISVASSGNPSVAGQQVTYIATVSVTSPGTGNPTGNVKFLDGGSPISGCASQGLTGSSTDTATCAITYASSGSHTITAQYLVGTNDYAASAVSSPITQTVNSLSYSGSTSASMSTIAKYYKINTFAAVGSTTNTANGLTLASGIHLTGLTFSVPSSSSSTFTAIIGYITGMSWTATAMTCTIGTGTTQCTTTGSVAIPTGDQISIRANWASGTVSYVGSWTVTYTQP